MTLPLHRSPWFTHYATLMLELDSPIVEALTQVHYWAWVDTAVELYRKSHPTPSRAWLGDSKFPWREYDDPVILDAIVRIDGLAIRHISKQTFALCLAAVRNTATALPHVRQESVTDDQYVDLCLEAVQRMPYVLIGISRANATAVFRRRYPDICRVAVQQDGWALESVASEIIDPDIYVSLCLDAVTNDGTALKHIAQHHNILHAHPEICLAAVQQNGLALKHIPHQTIEICRAAVHNNPLARKYVLTQLLPYIDE